MQSESASRGKERTDTGGGWLSSVTLASLAELNELALALLAEQAAARSSSGSPLLHMVAELWRTLDAPARRRAADCPYLLVDAGFTDGLRWQAAAGPQVGDAGDRVYAAYFSTPSAPVVTRLVFTYAWHLVRSQGAAAQLLLGMSATSAAAIARHTLPQIQALAESHTGWLTPRWPTRVGAWRELLLVAAAGEPAALKRAQLRGLTLLAAEARVSSARGFGRMLPPAGQ
jgi:hypothetical protein